MIALDPGGAKPRMLPPRARIVPVASTLAGSLLAALPLIVAMPIMPPTGLLMLIAWRLLRPELWAVWIGLPLGLFDDLLNGAPMGSAAAIWTTTLLVLDRMDNRTMWRDYWTEWLVAASALALCLIAGWALAHLAWGGGSVLAIVPQMLVTVLCVPASLRIAAELDRWRLGR